MIDHNQTKKIFENWHGAINEIRVFEPEYQKLYDDVIGLYEKIFSKRGSFKGTTAFYAFEEMKKLNISPKRLRNLKLKNEEQYNKLKQDNTFMKALRFLVKQYRIVKKAREEKEERKRSNRAFPPTLSSASPLAALSKAQFTAVKTAAEFGIGFGSAIVQSLDPRTWDAVDWILFFAGFALPVGWLAGLFRGVSAKAIKVFRSPAGKKLLNLAKKSPKITAAARQAPLLIKKFNEFKKSPVWNQLGKVYQNEWIKITRWAATFYVAMKVWTEVDNILRQALNMPRKQALQIGFSEEDLDAIAQTVAAEEYKKGQLIAKKSLPVILSLDNVINSSTPQEAKTEIRKAKTIIDEIADKSLSDLD